MKCLPHNHWRPLPKKRFNTLPPNRSPVPRDLYKQATELIQRKRREEAKKVLYTLIEDFPDSPIAPGVLYQIALLENGLTTKVNVFNRLIETYPESSWSEVARYKIAETYFIGGKYKEALHEFLRYTTEHPKAQYESQAIEGSAECYMRLGDYRHALKQYDNLFATFSDTLNRPEIFDAVAECYIMVNKIDAAVKVLDYAVKTFPNYTNNPSMYLSLFLCGLEQGNRELSQQAYTALTQSYPNSFHADVARSYLKKTRKPFFEMQ